ncbi:sensor histidine kinase [Reinekea thalattae]|uniref:histidine kinase n=1 Tax=Reinekea thalattae TaxID=2593301 RepID=A0A5C8ZBH1_9GAMM|nr:HAMP domain-containing sensor histidine kinase [Reinekea thalattae]TXR54629.1 HAMP domain-containing histidine kinase [Reinekea thalattae]
MNISRKLMVIVSLTVFEVSITIWAALQLSKGATFHQLNSLHLKYNVEYSNAVSQLMETEAVDVDYLRALIKDVQRQPAECLLQVNAVDKLIMSLINTSYALDICKKDVADANVVLAALDQFENQELSYQDMLMQLRRAVDEFTENSTRFEKPITKTVNFIITVMLPMIVIISLCNILFISYLSRNISGSIRGVINILSADGQTDKGDTVQNLIQRTSGELGLLLKVAVERIEQDAMNEESNSLLKKIVDSRTASLKQANEELEQFSYRASHDLKSPLTTTRQLIKLIEMDMAQGDYQEAQVNLTKIDSQTTQLIQLVEDMMTLAKADVSEVDAMHVDFSDIASAIQNKLAIQIEASSVQFGFSFPADGTFYGEYIRLQQILENLIANAIKYKDNNKTTPMVSVEIADSGKSTVISVKDNGLGIPKEYQHLLFKKFRRFHPQVSQGSGLGLAIVKKHVDMMKGTISFISSDQGTEFNVMIPKYKGS